MFVMWYVFYVIKNIHDKRNETYQSYITLFFFHRHKIQQNTALKQQYSEDIQLSVTEIDLTFINLHSKLLIVSI